MSFSTYSTVRTRFSPDTSSTYSSVRLVTFSPTIFSLSRTVVFPGLLRTANLGKSALEGLSWTHAMLLVPLPWTCIKSSKVSSLDVSHIINNDLIYLTYEILLVNWLNLQEMRNH